MLSSSSWLGHYPLTVEIAGSSPAGSNLKQVKLKNLQWEYPKLSNAIRESYEFTLSHAIWQEKPAKKTLSNATTRCL